MEQALAAPTVQEPLSDLQKDAANLLFALHDAWPYVHGHCTIESRKKAIQALIVKHGDFADLHPPAAQPAPELKPVKFGMNGEKMMFKVGVQQFTLDYEPDTQDEFNFMRDMLVHAFSTFTPDVKTTPPAQPAVPLTDERVGRTDREIVDQTEELAGLLMQAFHRREKADPLSTFRGTQDIRAQHCWQIACQIQEMLTDTDPMNAVAEVDDEAANSITKGQP
jgi:hypothetical protein